MTKYFLDPENWYPIDCDTRKNILPINIKRGGWVSSLGIFQKHFSVLELYSYLKCRFGNPNGGCQRLIDQNTSDNLIQWHYQFLSQGYPIDIFGLSTAVQINFYFRKKFTKKNWITLLSTIKSEFIDYSDQMVEAQTNFDKRILFVNPYPRIAKTASTVYKELKGLIKPRNRIYKIRDFTKMLSKEDNLITKSLSLFIISSILFETFVNSIIFFFRGESIKSKNKFDEYTELPLKERILKLHLNCVYVNEINFNEFNHDYKVVMGHRNDMLHGNIKPNKYKIIDICFDQNTPLLNTPAVNFYKLINTVTSKYIEADKALKTYETCINLIKKLEIYIDSKHIDDFRRFLQIPYPGWDISKNKPGILLPENLVYSEPAGNKFYDNTVEMTVNVRNSTPS